MPFPLDPETVQAIPIGGATAGGLYDGDDQRFIDAMLVPMRRKRDLFVEGYRREGSGSYDFDPAPVWAAVCVQKLVRTLFQRIPDTLLRDLTAHLLAEERRALAALVVFNTVLATNKNWQKRMPLHAVRDLTTKLSALP